jgi:hypothetical protein
MIEVLESRTLLSASPIVRTDLAVIRAQASVVRTEISVIQKTATADATLIRKDLQRLGTLRTDRSLLNSLLNQERPDLNQLKKQANTLINSGTNAINRVVGDFNRLESHPGNPTLQAKLAADTSLLQTGITSAQASVNTDSSLITTDGTIGLNVIAGANSSDAQTQTDVANAKTDLSTGVGAVASDVSLLLTDVSALLNAFNG